MQITQLIKKQYVLNEYRLFITLIYALSFYAIYKLVVGDASLWWLALVIFWHKFIQLFGNTIGMHRYFSHKSFNTTPAMENFLAWVSMFLGVGSPMQYARNHRQHHKVADQPTDWHSPTNDGKLATMLGLWEFHSLSWFMERGGYTPRDLLAHPTYRFIHNHYYKIWYPMLVITWLINPLITLYFLALPSFLVHLDFNILTNCIAHSWGYRNFDTPDTSRNNQWLDIIQAGEGLHNNHHAHPQLYDFAVKSGEFDFSAWVIEKYVAIDGEQTRQGKLRID
jgi:fatty-acid desaturase